MDLLDRNRERFEWLLRRAERHALRGRFDLAAAWAEIAADQAYNAHPGFFADNRLERLLHQLGTTAAPPPYSPESKGKDWPRRVLHVLTEAYAIGGHTRFAWRWIDADRERQHCIVLTRQRLTTPLPQPLLDAPQATGGWVRWLDWCNLLPVARAKQLRVLATEFDLVVLHISAFDVVPALAFAEPGLPIVLVNQAGFKFWNGRDVADVVACLRPSSRAIAIERRGIDPTRCPPLPIPVSPPDRNMSRAEARRVLGLPLDATILFSVASAYKYVPFEPGPSFPELMMLLARCDKRVRVLVIGPSDEGPWRKAREETDGRVRALGRHPAVDLHERAADIYLDPFPMTSPTAFLEAGSYGLPIISFCPHRDRAPVLCADDFALDDRLIRVASTESLVAKVKDLIDDVAAREAQGEATAAAVMAGHGPEGFKTRLAGVYACAASAHEIGRSAAGDGGEAGRLDECLVRLRPSTGITLSLGGLTLRHLEALPYVPRQLIRLKSRLGSYLRQRRVAVPAISGDHFSREGESLS